MLINIPKIATFEVVGSAEVSFAVLIARNKLLCVVSFRDTVCSQLVTIQHYYLVAKPFVTHPGSKPRLQTPYVQMRMNPRQQRW